MAGSSSGSSVSSNQSTSTSFIPPELLPALNNLTQYAQTLQGNAQSIYQNAGNSINGIINQGLLPSMAKAASAGDAANALYQGYTPQDFAALHQYINTFNNPEAINANYVAPAEANAAQAGDAARQNSIRDLQAYGIDPSAGRYSALDEAQRASTAANSVGAGNQARIAAQDRYANLLSELPSADAQLGQSANAAYNTVGQLGSTATNAQLGLGNMYSSFQSPIVSALGEAARPSLGTQSQSTGSSSSVNQSQSTDPQQQQSGGGQQQQGGGGSGGGGSNSSPSIGSGGLSGDGYTSGPASGTNYPSDPYANPGDQQSTNYPDPYANPGDQQSTNYPDPYANPGDQNYPSGDTSGGSSSDTGPYYPDSSSADSSGAYAGGGGVIPNDPTTGGYVPPAASPSMGRRTDDVNARLNAGEFVIPKDVAAWKGQEFFQKLIETSRKNRVMSPAQAQRKPPLTGQPNFISRRMAA